MDGKYEKFPTFIESNLNERLVFSSYKKNSDDFPFGDCKTFKDKVKTHC